MGLYNEGLAHGSARYLANVIKCALVTSAYSPNVDHNGYAAFSTNEYATSPYTAGGVALSSKVLNIDNTNDLVHEEAADVSFGNLVSGTARYAIIYDEDADLLLRYIDFGSDKTFNGGSVTLRFTNSRVRTRQAA